MADFRIASYNLKDFNVPQILDRVLTRKLRQLSRTIDAIAPDFIGLQEVGSTRALDALNDALKSPFPWSGLVVGNSTRNQHIGYLSRYPVTVTSHVRTPLKKQAGETLTRKIGPRIDHCDHNITSAEDSNLLEQAVETIFFQRDLVLADVNTPGGRIGIFIAHLKSMRVDSDPDFPDNPNQDDIRTAECLAVRSIATAYEKRHNGRPVVIIGDLNANNTMTSLQPLLNGIDYMDVLQSDWVDLGNHPSYSYRNPPAKARLDYILLGKRAQERYLAGSARIHRAPDQKTASDHLPVSATLRLPRHDLTEETQ